MRKEIRYNLDCCNNCGDNIGEVEMSIRFDDDGYPMAVEALETASCSCGNVAVERGKEYEILDFLGEGDEIEIYAIGGEK